MDYRVYAKNLWFQKLGYSVDSWDSYDLLLNGHDMNRLIGGTYHLCWACFLGLREYRPKIWPEICCVYVANHRILKISH